MPRVPSNHRRSSSPIRRINHLAFASRPATARKGILPLLATLAAFASTPAIAADECPDLAGTYSVFASESVTKVFGLWKHSRIGSRPLVTFRRNGTGWKVVWHRYREDSLSAARLQAQGDRTRYGHWLDMTFRDPSLPLPAGVADEDEWLARKAGAGPSLEVGVDILPFKRCKGGMFLVSGPARRAGPPSFEGGSSDTREIEAWLGRGPGGALVLQAEEHATIEITKPARGYKELSVRKGSRTHTLGTWTSAPAQDLTPWRAEELPAVERPSQRRPRCEIDPANQDVFHRNLKAMLQPPSQLEGFTSSIYAGRPRPDGSCEPTDFTVIAEVPDAATASKLADFLAREPFVKQVVSKDEEDRGGGRKRVRFRLKVGP
ncbi:MAG TPA: hypothetical protein PLD37_00010 [Usitatibacteraceae bacterium]|nr:hypothetical protein [Usitatibacteraceae bacterium]